MFQLPCFALDDTIQTRARLGFTMIGSTWLLRFVYCIDTKGWESQEITRASSIHIKNLFADTKMCSVSVLVIAKWCVSATLDRKQPSPSTDSPCPASSVVRCSCSAAPGYQPRAVSNWIFSRDRPVERVGKAHLLPPYFVWLSDGKASGRKRRRKRTRSGGVVSRVAARRNNLLKSHLISPNVWHLWHILTFILLCSLSRLRLRRSAEDQMEKRKEKNPLSAALPSSSY